MQIADAEFGAGNMDGEVYFAAPAQVLDAAPVNISTYHQTLFPLLSFSRPPLAISILPPLRENLLAITTMLRPSGDRPRPFLPNLLRRDGIRAAGMNARWQRRESNNTIEFVGRD
jgi:hypothetical protein